MSKLIRLEATPDVGDNVEIIDESEDNIKSKYFDKLFALIFS